MFMVANVSHGVSGINNRDITDPLSTDDFMWRIFQVTELQKF